MLQVPGNGLAKEHATLNINQARGDSVLNTGICTGMNPMGYKLNSQFVEPILLYSTELWTSAKCTSRISQTGQHLSVPWPLFSSTNQSLDTPAEALLPVEYNQIWLPVHLHSHKDTQLWEGRSFGHHNPTTPYPSDIQPPINWRASSRPTW